MSYDKTDVTVKDSTKEIPENGEKIMQQEQPRYQQSPDEYEELLALRVPAFSPENHASRKVSLKWCLRQEELPGRARAL